MNRSPLQPISDDDIEEYTRNGVVCLRQQFDSDWIDALRVETERAMAAPGPFAEEYEPAGRGGRYFGDIDVSRRWAAFRKFVVDSCAAEIAGRIMRSSKVNFFYDQLLVKEPGTSARTPWHQDQPYWAVRGRQVCSIWLPLDPVPRATAVQYVAGSHAWGAAFNPQHFIDGSPYRGLDLPPLPDIDAEPDRYSILGWDLEPGDCLVFQAMVVHGSAGNASAVQRRRALATRWTGDDAVYWRGEGEVAIPTEDPGLANGTVMDSEMFPVIWRAPA